MAITNMLSVSVDITSKEIFRAQEPTMVTIIKTTSGQVAIGTNQDIAPPSSGKGALLPLDQAVTFFLFKGDILSAVGAAAGQSLSLITHPLPPLAGGAGAAVGPGGMPMMLPNNVCR